MPVFNGVPDMARCVFGGDSEANETEIRISFSAGGPAHIPAVLLCSWTSARIS